VKMRAVHAYELVATLPITRVYRRDQMEILKKFQVPVNSRDIHGRAQSSDPFMDLLDCSEALNLMHNRQHHLALRSEPESALSQLFEELFLAGHCNDLRFQPNVTPGIAHHRVSAVQTVPFPILFSLFVSTGGANPVTAARTKEGQNMPGSGRKS